MFTIPFTRSIEAMLIVNAAATVSLLFGRRYKNCLYVTKPVMKHIVRTLANTNRLVIDMCRINNAAVILTTRLKTM